MLLDTYWNNKKIIRKFYKQQTVPDRVNNDSKETSQRKKMAIDVRWTLKYAYTL